MSVYRRKHFAVEKLRPEGQEAVRRGLEAGKTYEAIAEDVEATGETISVNALFNWARALRVAQLEEERQSTLERTLEAIKAAPDPRFIALIGNVVRDGLLGRREELEKQDLPELLALLARFEKLQLAHKKIEADTIIAQAERIKANAAMERVQVAQQLADVATRKVVILEQQLRQVGGKLKEAEGKVREGRALTAEELGQIREQVFGLVAQVEEHNEEGADAPS